MSSDNLKVLTLFPTVSELRFYGCCHPCFLMSILGRPNNYCLEGTEGVTQSFTQLK